MPYILNKRCFHVKSRHFDVQNRKFHRMHAVGKILSDCNKQQYIIILDIAQDGKRAS